MVHLSIPSMSYSLQPNFFATSFFFSQYTHHNHLTHTSKLFKPIHLPNPNCNQRRTPFHFVYSSWQRSTYVANCPHPIKLTHSLDLTSDVCIVQVHHFYSRLSTNSFRITLLFSLLLYSIFPIYSITY